MVGPMSTRTFLMLTSGAIVLLAALLLSDKYGQCLATRPAGACPELGPYVGRSGKVLPLAPRDGPLTARRP
jgi:hypothetical protein